MFRHRPAALHTRHEACFNWHLRRPWLPPLPPPYRSYRPLEAAVPAGGTFTSTALVLDVAALASISLISVEVAVGAPTIVRAIVVEQAPVDLVRVSDHVGTAGILQGLHLLDLILDIVNHCHKATLSSAKLSNGAANSTLSWSTGTGTWRQP